MGCAGRAEAWQARQQRGWDGAAAARPHHPLPPPHRRAHPLLHRPRRHAGRQSHPVLLANQPKENSLQLFPWFACEFLTSDALLFTSPICLIEYLNSLKISLRVSPPNSPFLCLIGKTSQISDHWFSIQFLRLPN